MQQELANERSQRELEKIDEAEYFGEDEDDDEVQKSNEFKNVVRDDSD